MNQDFFSSVNKNKTRCNNQIDKTDNIKSKCQNMICNPCNRYCYVVGPTGPTGATGPQGLQGIQGKIGPNRTCWAIRNST